jgi:hypothetical protein
MILTPLEFIQISPVTKDFPPTEVCALIDTEELLWYDECELGIGLYDALKDDLTEIPETTAEWSRHKSYAIDDVVTYYGALLKSKTASNTVEPCLDSDGINWEILPKFKTPCVQQSWKHIALAFSYRLLSLNLVTLTYKISAKGTTKYSDDFRQNTSGLVTVERGERHDLQQSIDMSADRYYMAMIKHLKRVAPTCTVLQAASFYEASCDDCKPKNSGRRIAYRK